MIRALLLTAAGAAAGFLGNLGAAEAGASDRAVTTVVAIGEPISTPVAAVTSDPAIARWTQRTAANPNDADAWINLGNALMQESREQPGAELYERAETAFDRALTLVTNHAEAMVGLAWVHNTRHEFDAGRRFARNALALDPGLQHAYALLGDAAVELGDYDDAFEQYQKALDLRPDLSSYSRSAQLLWLTGDARKARWLMQKAIATGGPHAENTAWCRAELALMLFNTGALLAAEQEAAAALKQAPSNHHALAVMGRIRTARKDYEGATEFYSRSLAVTPTHEALAGLVDVAILQGRPDEAARHARQVVKFHTVSAAHSHGGNTPTHAHSHPHGNAQLARFFADHNRDLDQALEEAKEAYETFPNIFVTDTLAWCLFRKGRFQEAERTIRKALRWNTPNAEIHFHAGMICASIGNRPLAQKHLYHALSLNPQFHPIFSQTAVDTLKALSEGTNGTRSNGE